MVAALEALKPGGTVAVNAIHLDRVPEFDYQALWMERGIRSVANFTRRDAEEFLALELFRFVRHGEKIVTRMAGQMIQLYDPKTMLPGTERTLRTLTEEVVEAGEDPGLRIELTEYLDSLTKWLGAILHAFPQAAEDFAFKLRSDLSEASLTRDDPIPRLKRLSGQAEGELWERACKVLNRLSDETVRDGVESLARRHAESFVEEPSGE